MLAIVGELKAKIASFVAAAAGLAADSFGTAIAVKARRDGTYYFASRNC